MATTSWTSSSSTATAEGSRNVSSSLIEHDPEFSLHVSVGSYGSDAKIVEILNQSCKPTTTVTNSSSVPSSESSSSSTTSNTFTNLAAKFLFPSSSVSIGSSSSSTPLPTLKSHAGNNSPVKPTAVDDDDNNNNNAATATGTADSTAVKKSASTTPYNTKQSKITSTTIGHTPFFVASVSKLQIFMDRRPDSVTTTTTTTSTTTERIWSKLRQQHTNSNSVNHRSATTDNGTANTETTKHKNTNNDCMIMGLFLPPHVTSTCLEQHYQQQKDQKPKQDTTFSGGSSFWIKPPSSLDFVHILCPKVHPNFPVVNVRLVGILVTNIASDGAAADLVLLEVPCDGTSSTGVAQSLLLLNGEPLAADNHCVIKVLPLSNVNVTYTEEEEEEEKGEIKSSPTQQQQQQQQQQRSTTTTMQSIPVCPVCLHRIDPSRLALPPPSSEQICSKYCPSPGFWNWNDNDSLMSPTLRGGDCFCPQQKLLWKWQPPARCKACEVIDVYWNTTDSSSSLLNQRNNNNSRYGTNSLLQHHHHDGARELFCGECSMHKTLWVCLTCGFVGCGRYSNRHSVEHFEKTNHPYSLELATLRIWDYCAGEDGGFIQRADLLTCPSSPPLAHPLRLGLDSDLSGASSSAGSWGGYADGRGQNHSAAPAAPHTEKPSKKTVMVGVEYETQLQSALEDQAMFYEGEIARLTTELSHSILDEKMMSNDESTEIEQLQEELQKMQLEVDIASKELLLAQADEAEKRARSQKLLTEQQVSTELLKKVQEEHAKENEIGKQQIEDLEQQIADLNANLRMRHEFSSNRELNNAQIFGTTSNTPNTSRKQGSRGRKKGKSSRR